jgi:hypothetical protein
MYSMYKGCAVCTRAPSLNLLKLTSVHVSHIVSESACVCEADHLRDQAGNRAEVLPHPAHHGSSGQVG